MSLPAEAVPEQPSWLQWTRRAGVEGWVQPTTSWRLNFARSGGVLAENQWGKRLVWARTQQQHRDCCAYFNPCQGHSVQLRWLALTYSWVYGSSLWVKWVPELSLRKHLSLKAGGSFVSSAGGRGPKYGLSIMGSQTFPPLHLCAPSKLHAADYKSWIRSPLWKSCPLVRLGCAPLCQSPPGLGVLLEEVTWCRNYGEMAWPLFQNRLS